MTKKTVPAPTKGRVVMYHPTESDESWAAFVVRVSATDPRLVQLAVFDYVAYDLGNDLPVVTGAYVPYGENQPGCWWWPERSDATIEVEAE